MTYSFRRQKRVQRLGQEAYNRMRRHRGSAYRRKQHQWLSVSQAQRRATWEAGHPFPAVPHSAQHRQDDLWFRRRKQDAAFYAACDEAFTYLGWKTAP